MRGRKPKPTSIKVLEGNPGKRPLSNREPEIPAGNLECPPHLQGEARKEWDRVIGILSAAKVVTEIDRGGLVMMCEAWGRWVFSTEQVIKHGYLIPSLGPCAPRETLFGTVKPEEIPLAQWTMNQWQYIANKAMEQYQKWASEFGMTPSSRSRVQAGERDQDDDLGDFIDGEEAETARPN